MIKHPTSRFERKFIEKKKSDDNKKKKQKDNLQARLDAIREGEDNQVIREYLNHV